MAITFIPGANPIWDIINLIGTLAGGAKLYTKSSLTFMDKAVYSTASTTSPTPYPNPIIFNANGTQGPFYFEFDDANPDDLYFLQAKDSAGNILWTVNPYNPATGGGGGGNVTTIISLENYISNGSLIDHCDPVTVPTTTTNLVIAPSNHKGFTPADITPVIGTYGAVGPDIRFVRNSTASLDQILFTEFALADDAFNTINGVTPVFYCNYISSNTSAGELYKAFQFPISQKVKNLSNQGMTFQLFAMATTNVTLNVYTRQYYGNGTGATAESGATRQLVGTCPLTNLWTKFTVPFTVPNVGGNTIGAVNNQTDDDGLYIQLDMPLNINCDVSFILPVLHLGTIGIDKDFDTYDQIYGVAQNVRTGSTMIGYGSAPRGWVACDTTIGNNLSGANRANKDTFFLYKTVWDGVADAFAPVNGAPGNRGASAIADFLANKPLTLSKMLGRAIAAAGAGTGLTARTLGQFLGSEVITINAMPLHNHGSLGGGSFYSDVGSPFQVITYAGGNNLQTNAVTASRGGGTLNTQGVADGNMQPTSFLNVFLKL